MLALVEKNTSTVRVEHPVNGVLHTSTSFAINGLLQVSTVKEVHLRDVARQGALCSARKKKHSARKAAACPAIGSF